MCALPGPLSQCASVKQTSYCSSSSSPFMTTPPPPPNQPHPPPPPPISAGNRRVQGWQQWGGHLLILKIWTGISLLSKSVVMHLMGHCPDPPKLQPLHCHPVERQFKSTAPQEHLQGTLAFSRSLCDSCRL